MKTNESNTDRIIRVIVGVLLVYLGTSAPSLLEGTVAILVAVVGAVLLATAFVGFCPIYYFLKIKTNK
jgi:hypothetical protein